MPTRFPGVLLSRVAPRIPTSRARVSTTASFAVLLLAIGCVDPDVQDGEIRVHGVVRDGLTDELLSDVQVDLEEWSGNAWEATVRRIATTRSNATGEFDLVRRTHRGPSFRVRVVHPGRFKTASDPVREYPMYDSLVRDVLVDVENELNAGLQPRGAFVLSYSGSAPLASGDRIAVWLTYAGDRFAYSDEHRADLPDEREAIFLDAGIPIAIEWTLFKAGQIPVSGAGEITLERFETTQFTVAF